MPESRTPTNPNTTAGSAQPGPARDRREIATIDLEQMLICSLRYSLGRMTCIVSDCDRWVRTYWPQLGTGAREVILTDLATAIEQERHGRRSLGMDIDRETWMRLYDDLKAGTPPAAPARTEE